MTFDRKKRRNGGSWDRVQFLSIPPPHTKTHTSVPSSAFFESNQIPCALSAHPLSWKNVTWSRAQTCHSEEAKRPYAHQKNACPPPKHTTHTSHLHFCFCFYEKELRLITGPALSLNFLFQCSRAFLKTQSCASVERPLGSMALLVENQRLEFFFQRASDNLRGELVRDQVCGPRLQVAGRPLRAPAPLWGGGGELQETWSTTGPSQCDRQTARSLIRNLLFQRQQKSHSDSVTVLNWLFFAV